MLIGYRFADMCCSNYEEAEENSRILQEEAKYETIVDGKVKKYIKCCGQKKHHKTAQGCRRIVRRDCAFIVFFCAF